MKPSFTPRQGEYLAFIWQYTNLMNAPPSEGDVADFFGVSGPSAHQMMVTLEKRGLLSRVPGLARSTRLTVPRGELPLIGGPEYRGSNPVRGLTAFAVFLAQRLGRRTTSLAAFAATLWISERLERMLLDLGARPGAAERARARFLAATGASELLGRRPAGAPTATTRSDVPSARPETARRKKRRSEPPEGQGNLF